MDRSANRLFMEGRNYYGAGGSDSGSDKERRDRSRLEPDSRLTPPSSDHESDHGEGSHAGPSAVPHPSPTGSLIFGLDGACDCSKGLPVIPEVSSWRDDATAVDQREQTPLTVVTGKGKEVDRSQHGSTREPSRRQSVSTRDTKSTRRHSNSVSDSIEPFSPITPVTPVEKARRNTLSDKSPFTPVEKTRRNTLSDIKSVKEAVKEAMDTDITTA